MIQSMHQITIILKKLSHIIDHTSKSGILHTAISDHLGTFTTFHYKSIKSNPKYVVIQKQDQVALEAFKNAISPESILSRINSSNWGDPNHTFEVISTEIKIAKDKFLPSKRVRFNKYKHKNKNWITLGILKSIHTRDKLYTKYKSCKHTNDNYNLNKTRYNNFNRILKKAINEAKNKYYSNEFSKYRDNLKKSWETINQILNRDKKSSQCPTQILVNSEKITDKQKIAEKFNTYFATIGETLASNIPNSNTSYENYIKEKIFTSFSFQMVDET